MHIHPESLQQTAARFALNPQALTLLGGMDGLAYAYTQAVSDVVLKVTPLAANQPEQLQQTLEKFAFVRFLAEHGVAVAAPLPSPQGKLAEAVTGPDGDWLVPLTGRARGSEPHASFVSRFFSEFIAGYRLENQLSQQCMAELPFFLRHHQLLLYIFFSNQVQSNPEPWMRSALTTWRDEILNDIPVMKFPLHL